MTSEFTNESRRGDEPGIAGSPQYSLNIKRALFVRAPIIIGVFVLVVVPASLGAWFLSPLEFIASATLQFLVSTPRVMSGGRGVPTSVPYEKYVATQIALIEDDTILLRVLQDRSVADSRILAGVDDPLEHLKDKLSVRQQSNSELALIRFRSSDRQGAITILTEIINTYIEYAATVEANAGGNRMGTLMETRDGYQLELERQLEQLAALTRRVDVPLTDVARMSAMNAEIFGEALNRAEESFLSATALVTQTDQIIEQVTMLSERRLAAPTDPVYELDIEDRVLNQPSVMAIQQQLIGRETELESLEANRTDGAVGVVAARESLDILERKLDAEKSDVRDRVIRSIQARLQRERSTAQKNAEDANDRMEDIQQRLEDYEIKYNDAVMRASAISAERDELSTKVEQTRNVLDGIRVEITSLRIESNAPGRVRLASNPVVPERPYRGRRLQLLVFAVFGSMALGLGTGMARELMDQHVHSPQEVYAITRLPVLAAIPNSKDDRLVEAKDSPLPAVDFPHSPTANEYRRILARVIYPPDSGVEINSCLVVSPTRGDGKTSVACNLAGLLAQANRQVLVIDCCGQNPRVEACFGLKRGPGLAEILHDTASLNLLVRPTYLPNLSVLGPGLRAEDVSGKLASREMMKLMEDAEHDYDHVLIDSEPFLLMSGAKLLAPFVDGVVIVVGARTSTRGMLRRCLDEMAQVNAEVVGIVLNAMRPTRGGYLRRNLDMFYQYASESFPGGIEADEDLPEIRVVDEEPGETAETGLDPVVLLTAGKDDAEGQDEEHA